MNSILIATIKKEEELAGLINELKSKAVLEYEVIISSSEGSVAYNSNRGLERAKGEIILKVDDDVFDFPQGWDKLLIDTLSLDKNIVIASARVLNPNGTVQKTCSNTEDLTPDIIDPPSGLAPFCCVAFRNDGLRFDEVFQGSSYDDTDFNLQLRMKYPSCRVVINNKIQIKHKLESKVNRFGANQELFLKKWQGVVFPDGKIRV